MSILLYSRTKRSSEKPRLSGRYNALHIVVWGMLFLLATECLLRFGLGLGHPVVITKDPFCGYLIRPDQHLFRLFAHIDINHYGMRSEELSDKLTGNQYRVMFIGDSITYGTSRIDQKLIFTGILRRELPRKLHRPVEVLNASASAWAIDNELEYLRSRGTFHSDIVALVLNSGDLTQTRATVDQAGSSLRIRQDGFAWAEVVRQIAMRLKKENHEDAGDQIQKGPSTAGVVRENLERLDQIRLFTAKQQAKLVVLFIPFQKEIRQSEESRMRLREWCNQHQLPFVDLTPTLAPYTVQEVSLDGGTHLNGYGNRLVADGILKAWQKEWSR